jgi:aminoglycoside 3-N-acetyltransferase
MNQNAYNWQNAAKAQVHKALRRWFDQETRANMKKWQGQARKRVSRFLPLLHGTYTSKELIGELKSHVPDDFEILMVHSAFDKLLPMYRGTAIELLNELINYCGKDRTLVMPAFVLGGRLYDKVSYFSTHAFDIKRTPSEMGMLSELFRRTTGVVRSLHPTHSVCALGPLAEKLVADHHMAPERTGYGTPFEFMNQHRTAIIGLGIEYFRSLTHMLTAIDMMGEAYPVELKRRPIPATMIDANGNKYSYSVIIPEGARPPDNTLLRSLLSNDELKEWKFHGTAMYATYAKVVTDRLIDAAKRGVTVYGSSSRRTA